MPAPLGTRGRVPRLMAEGDGGQGPVLCAHRGAFGEEQKCSSLHGGRPLHGHRPPRDVCRGGAWRAAQWRYLFIC